MIPEKTNKQLVWEAVKNIEVKTADLQPYFVILNEGIWKEYPIEYRLRIRALLLHADLIQVVNGQQWAFQLTPKGMMLSENDLNDDGTLKLKTDSQYWKGIKTALIGTIAGVILGTLLSGILEVWKVKYLSPPQTSTIVLPKIQVVHDTVWMTTKPPKFH